MSKTSCIVLKNNGKENIEVYIYPDTGSVGDVLPANTLTYTVLPNIPLEINEISSANLEGAEKFAIKASEKKTFIHWDEKQSGLLLGRNYEITFTTGMAGTVPNVVEKNQTFPYMSGNT